MFYPLKFNPVYKNYIWGGHNLKKINKNIPQEITAESWELSTHEDGVSVVSNGELKEKTLNKLINKYGVEILGTNVYDKYRDMPILIKFIDAQKDLSVQVHPDDRYAIKYENGQNGKTEMWYILDAEENSNLVYGLKKGITKESFIKTIDDNIVEECLNYISVNKGDVLNIPAGTVHAIGAGLLIAEVQQKSNLTYRVYDYNRVGNDGKKRELHIDKALKVIDFDNNEMKKCTSLLNLNEGCMIKNEYFSLTEINVIGTIKESSRNESCHVFIFLDGEGAIFYENKELKVKKGDTVLIPAVLGDYELKGNFKILRVDIL